MQHDVSPLDGEKVEKTSLGVATFWLSAILSAIIIECWSLPPRAHSYGAQFRVVGIFSSLEIADTCIRLVSQTIKPSKGSLSSRISDLRRIIRLHTGVVEGEKGNKDILCRALLSIKLFISQKSLALCRRTNIREPNCLFRQGGLDGDKPLKSILDNNFKLRFHSPPRLVIGPTGSGGFDKDLVVRRTSLLSYDL
jgi:hypothetical protein